MRCQTLAVDLRGHGCSSCEDEIDLSAQRMAKDISDVVEEYVKSLENQPEIILIGKQKTFHIKLISYNHNLIN